MAVHAHQTASGSARAERHFEFAELPFSDDPDPYSVARSMRLDGLEKVDRCLNRYTAHRGNQVSVFDVVRPLLVNARALLPLSDDHSYRLQAGPFGRASAEKFLNQQPPFRLHNSHDPDVSPRHLSKVDQLPRNTLNSLGENRETNARILLAGPVAIATFIPIISLEVFSRGPPELRGFIAASV